MHGLKDGHEFYDYINELHEDDKTLLYEIPNAKYLFEPKSTTGT
jgi:hypothetical protein